MANKRTKRKAGHALAGKYGGSVDAAQRDPPTSSAVPVRGEPAASSGSHSVQSSPVADASYQGFTQVPPKLLTSSMTQIPTALNDTWLVINASLRASRREAARRFTASRHRVEALRHNIARRRAQYQAERKRLREAKEAARLLKGLGSHDDTVNFAVGATLFGLLFFVAGAAPGLLPLCYIGFFLYMVPSRTAYFVARKWQFFLIDFCY
eukprot:scaffold619148_cov47-Prasinocladus_malaysianus.AAC.1